MHAGVSCTMCSSGLGCGASVELELCKVEEGFEEEGKPGGYGDGEEEW